MDPLAELVGQSAAIAAVRERVRRFLQHPPDSRRLPPVLILGETGTGKGLLARTLHRAGSRRDGPFIDINCAAIPDDLIESEMFGFVRDAFTGARQSKAGLFQAAHHGTIFLDEVGLLPLAAQGKLVTAIEDRTVRRVGANHSETVDVWVLSATSVDLAAAVREGSFREDLYHRLAVLPFSLPPLRERDEDVVLLAEQLLARACMDYGLPPRELAVDARAALRAHAWPGNVRELANVMERVAVLEDAPVITAAMLELPGPTATRPPPLPSTARLGDVVANVEREHVLATLERMSWNVTRAAEVLGISRDTLRYRMEKHDLHREGHSRRQRSASAPLSGAGPGVERRREGRRLTFLGIALSGAEASSGQLGHEMDVLRDKVLAFGGRVEAWGPDWLLAVFGLAAVEDAPRRAAHAALAVRRALEPAGRATAIRSALHGSEYVLTGTDDGFELDPEARHEARRAVEALLNIVEPGAILADRSVTASLRRRFEIVPFVAGSHIVGGRLVGHEQTGFQIGRRVSPFVGRQQEIEVLERRLATAVGGRGQVVGIVGEAGIGKSRLLYELHRRLAERAVTFLETACLSYGTTRPYVPLLDLVRQTLGLVHDEPPAAVAAIVMRGLAEIGLDAQETLQIVLNLLEVPGDRKQIASLSPQGLKTRTFETLRQLWLRSSRRRPIVLAVEDVHWIDPISAEWLLSLVAALPAAPILCVVTYRPGYQPSWLDRSYAIQIALEPLAAEGSLSVARSVLGESALSDELARSILGTTEGNPFFIEEVCWAFGTGTRAAPGDLAALDLAASGDVTRRVPVPATVQDVLRARMDALAAAPRRLLQAAAVLGRAVPAQLLRAVWPDPVGLEAAMRELMQREFLHEGTADGAVLVFKHALTQEVAYESLPPDDRRSLHAAAGAAIERLQAGRLDEALDQLAHHWARAGNPDKAAAYLTRFAEKAAAKYANVEAATALRQAIGQLERSASVDRDARHVELALRLVRSLSFLGRFEEIVTVMALERERLDRLADPALTGPAEFWLARTWSMLGDPERTVAHARLALDAADRCGDAGTAGGACYALAYECFWSGRPAEGLRWGREAVARLEQTGDRWWLVYAHWVTGINHGLAGRFTDAQAAQTRALAVAEEIGDPRHQSLVMATTGAYHALAGDRDAAIAACRRALDVAPDPVSLALARGFLAGVHLERGEAAQAIPLLEQSVADYRRFSVPQVQGWFTTLLGEARLLAGELDAARALLSDGLRITTEIRYRYGAGWAQRALGRLASVTGPVAEAEARLAEALETFAAAGASYDVARTHLDLARLASRRNLHDAESHLSTALALFEALALPRWVERTRRLAAELDARLS